jgi:hypothetical protein
MASHTLSIYFNLTDELQLLSATVPDGQSVLYSSGSARYLAADAAPERPANSLLPYECRVYGPSEWQRLGT